MMEIVRNLLLQLPEPWLWVLQVFFILLLIQGVNFFLSRFMLRLQQRAARTPRQWDNLLLEALRKPLFGFVWMLGLLWVLMITRNYSDLELFTWLSEQGPLATLLLVTWFLVRLINGLEQRLYTQGLSKKPMDRATAQAISRLLKAAVVITACLVGLQSLGVSISGLLAFGGVGGIAVGFAARDLLANFFGALMLYLDRPFAVGDWIRSPDREIEGTVEEIGWRLTLIRTFDQRPLYVPNAVFANIAVENPSRMYHRRINETLRLRYEDIDKVEQIVAEIHQYLQQHPDIETDQRVLIVNFVTYAPSSLDIMLYTFTKTTDWVDFHRIKQQVLLDIYAIIERAGAQLALPTQTLHLAEHQPSVPSRVEP